MLQIKQYTHGFNTGPTDMVTYGSTGNMNINKYCRKSREITDCELKFPMLCQEDYEYSLIVADSWQHRLLLLSPTKQLRDITPGGQLREPIGAVWWNDSLYISIREGVLIKYE